MEKKHTIEKPIQRSRFRLWCGRIYYKYMRYAFWYFGGIKFSKKQDCDTSKTPYLHFEHRTPLLRKLKDVDMQYQYNKIVNLKIAAKRLNGIVLRPGETFSYWKSIGNPTALKGYKKGIVLYCGTFRQGLGVVCARCPILSFG